jgi:hypothetical protein
MGNIKRITIDCQEGEIVEVNNCSLPLFIFHDKQLKEITPAEFNVCLDCPQEERWGKIQEYRWMLIDA